MTRDPFEIVVGDSAEELDVRLSDELDRFNSERTAGIAPLRELTVEVRDLEGALVAGLSGWTWGTCAGIGMVWVDENKRRTGLGTRLLAVFARQDGLPQPPHADVHLRKVLQRPDRRLKAHT